MSFASYVCLPGVVGHALLGDARYGKKIAYLLLVRLVLTPRNMLYRYSYLQRPANSVFGEPWLHFRKMKVVIITGSGVMGILVIVSVATTTCIAMA